MHGIGDDIVDNVFLLFRMIDIFEIYFTQFSASITHEGHGSIIEYTIEHSFFVDIDTFDLCDIQYSRDSLKYSLLLHEDNLIRRDDTEIHMIIDQVPNNPKVAYNSNGDNERHTADSNISFSSLDIYPSQSYQTDSDEG